MSRPRLTALLLALITLLVYLPVTRSGFLDYDDDDYVTHNQMVQNGLTVAGVQWAFTTAHASNWHPLTWLSHMTDCELFGLNPAAHHFVNVLFHAANSVLLFALLLRLTGALWPAAFVAALFAWHPLHVESVAWVAERKDVLSTFFALLSLLSYVRYARENRRRSLRVALVFFALGLMAKPMLVTLPCVMLLLDFWPLQRLNGSTVQRLLVEKVPFFTLTAISCIVTFLVQRNMAVASLDLVPMSVRLENVPVAYVAYLSKLFWPFNLAVIYPMPSDFQLPSMKVALAVTLLIFVSAAIWLNRKGAPYLPVGWLWFLGTLVPVIGLVQVGAQAFADRYTYFPAIGLFLMVAFGMSDLAGRWQISKVVVAVLGTLILTACLARTNDQLRYWQDSEVLFRHALAVTRDNHIAHINLGVALEQEGKLDEAIAEYRAAGAITPNRYQIHHNLGDCFARQGELTKALAEYREAVRLGPREPELHNSLGIALSDLGRYDKALLEFTNAAQLDPAYPWAYFEMGRTLLKLGRDAEGIAQFREALRLDPGNFQILTYSAQVLAAEENSQVRDGRTAFEFATKANNLTGGTQPLVLDALGMACAEVGDFTNATGVTQKALDLATVAKLKQTGAIRQRLALYQNHQPWRESFLATNVAPQVPPNN